jgi:hypothetical protein
MTTTGLFDDLPEAEARRQAETNAAAVRVSRPARDQIGWEMVDLDQLVSADHPVRLVVSFVASLDLSPLYSAIQARADGPGRNAIDPALLMGLWLFATVEGVGSAGAGAALHAGSTLSWLCGGVGVNHAVRWRGSEPPRFE